MQIDDRIAVTATTRTLAVSVQLGDTRIALTLPAPANVNARDEAGLRATALRLAARALEAALHDVRQEHG